MEKVYLSRKPNCITHKVYKNKDLSRLEAFNSTTKETIVLIEYNATNELNLFEKDGFIIVSDDYNNAFKFEIVTDISHDIVSIEYMGTDYRHLELSKDLKSQIKKLAQNIVDVQMQQLEDYELD